MGRQPPYLFTDTTVNIAPSADDLAAIACLAADFARRLGRVGNDARHPGAAQPGGPAGAVFGRDASAAGAASAVGPLIGAASAAVFGLRAPFVIATLILSAGVLVIAYRVRPETTSPANAVITPQG